MPTFNLPLGRGEGEGKINSQTVQASDTDTIDTGLSSIDSAQVTASTDGHIATVASTSSGSITLGLTDDAGSAVTSDETIHVTAVGQ